MGSFACAALVAACLVLGPRGAAAEEPGLSLEQVLALAKERGPRLLAAAARVEEARARRTGAAIWLHENPSLEAAAGRRYTDDGHSFAAQAGLQQRFELGGQRGARVAGAEAGIERASAARDESLRRLLREVSVAFFAALHAQQSLRLAESVEQLAAEVAHTAERRHRAEEVPVLEWNVSRAALARARSERGAAAAERMLALGELQTLLGMDATERIEVEGDLRGPHGLALAPLLERAGQRADLRALEARLAEAEAELRLARGEAWPDLGLGARYERDEGDDTVLGELSFALPVFDRAQGARAEASARARRLRGEVDALRRSVQIEVQTAFAAHAHRAEAAEALAGALPLLDENESLARRSYEAGEMGLIELLLIRREAMQIRREHLDRLLEAAVAAVDVEASAGVLE